MDFLAKSHPKETIEEHTQKLLDEFEKLKKLYPNINYLDWELLRLACLYHDLGKTNSKFQNKIKANIEGIKREKDDTEIPHGYLSPAFIPLENLTNEYNKDDIKVLMQSIYYHHIREQKDYIHIKKEIEEDLSNIYKDIDFLGLNIEKLNTKYSKYIRGRIEEDEDYNKKELVNIKKKYIMTKGLLNKIDYAASSGVEVEKENKDLFKCTMDFFNKGNFKPNELQKYMMENNNENIIAVASTGIGKTEAALLWIGNNKGFFTLPLRVSINAIYDRLIDREKINFPKEYTGLLHSNTASEYIKRDEEKELDKNYLDSTKQLSMPITVCTLDQLIDFVFKYEGYELKLATLSYSKLVIDEIQMYSPEMLAYLIVALKNIVEFGGKFAILTATLPPIVENLLLYPLLDNGKRITYKKSSKAFLKLDENGKSIIRHRIKVKDEAININDILENGKDKKVLVIVNTVNEAQRIYSELKNKLDNVNIFHARYINKDKKELEDRILSIGSIKSKEKGIWITTQVVEASLDIDFEARPEAS